jgi:N-acetyl-beta-hexosaminidase
MLDVCRHYVPIDYIYKFIDLLAMNKMNVFHWHLTDDQGWRIEIKKYPKLTEIGSKREKTLVDYYYVNYPQVFDGKEHGGYYTQEQIKDVVAYAASKYINVVPEIEMPGHALAALAAYPELSCDSTQTYKVSPTWGVFEQVFCPSETTFKFFEGVMDDVVHYCVANMPGAVARTATQALNNATLPFIIKLAEQGYVAALNNDKHLRKGLNVFKGQLTCAEVGQAHGLPTISAEQALSADQA